MLVNVCVMHHCEMLCCLFLTQFELFAYFLYSDAGMLEQYLFGMHIGFHVLGMFCLYIYLFICRFKGF